MVNGLQAAVVCAVLVGLTGGSASAAESAAQPMCSEEMGAIVGVDDRNVYAFAAKDWRVVAVPKTGGAISGFPPKIPKYLSAVAVDGEYVYYGWTLTLGGDPRGLMRMPRRGGPAVELAPTGTTAYHQIRIAGDWLFAVESGELIQMPKSGGPIARSLYRVAQIAVADGWIHAVSSSHGNLEIASRRISGGEVASRIVDGTQPRGLLAEAGRVYWSNGKGVFRMDTKPDAPVVEIHRADKGELITLEAGNSRNLFLSVWSAKTQPAREPLFRLAKQGGVPTLLAPTAATAFADEQGTYFIDRSEEHGRLVRAAP